MSLRVGVAIPANIQTGDCHTDRTQCFVGLRPPRNDSSHSKRDGHEAGGVGRDTEMNKKDIKPAITPIFSDCIEIRMGSPYNVCNLKLIGEWIPELPAYQWQDKFAYNDDKSIIALVGWRTDNNTPGFVIVTIDSNTKSVTESERYIGCCARIEWKYNKFSVYVF